ncbi:PAS domain-containing protein, partial [Cesiribacter andamanensis]|uniref:PAS domain-containing protein n=1 Tax=Cesiribacter andamanensis TaxID=649507 RepID=UPI00058BA6F1
MPEFVPTPADTTLTSLFEGESEMAALMRAYDWNAHPLGDPAHWPDSLKTTLRLILHSSFPMFVWWSEELYMFHNDAYLPALGKKHPQALGASAREMWAEIWEQIGEVVKGVMEEGTSFYARELRLLLERKGFLEETYWTFSYSPAPAEGGRVGGMFCACSEVTSTVLGQRRLKIINDVAEATVLVTSLQEAGRQISQVLSRDWEDLPFSLIYLLSAMAAGPSCWGSRVS